MNSNMCIYFSKGITTIILLLLITPFLRAQNQISFRNLSIKDGLSQNCAIAITQDSTGYLWIATQDGLNRYDGREFLKYPFQFIDITRSGYAHLGKLYIDKKKQLWAIPLDKTIKRFNPKTNSFVSIEGIKDAYTMYQDTNLNYWVSTYKKEILLMDSTSTQISKLVLDSPLQGMINEIRKLNKSTLILLGKNELIEININSKKSTIIRPKDTTGVDIEANFSAITFSTIGNQWLGTHGKGLFIRRKESRTLERIKEKDFEGNLPTDLNILDLLLDSKKRLWVATYGDGLYMVDFKMHRISHFKNHKHNPRTIQYNDVLCLYEDSLGTLWFGTDGAGLSYYDEYLEKFNSYTNYQTPENINIDVVRSISSDNDSIIWLGTSGKGLTRFDNQHHIWKTFTTENSGLPSNRIMSLFLDSNKDLWIGTQGGGLSILTPEGTFTKFSKTTTTKLSANTIWDIFKDSKDRFWLATNENGLIQFDKDLGEIKKYTNSGDNTSLQGFSIRVITEGKNNNLWLGTNVNGVFEFSINEGIFRVPKAIQQRSKSEKLIKTLLYTDDGILWIGTYGEGLKAYDIEKENYYSFTVLDGLANNVIYAILPDSEENLWLSSNKGITKFTPNSNLSEPPKVVNYSNYDGLATEFNTGASFNSPSGMLYYGGLEGYYWFQPKNIKNNTLLTRTIITKFEVLDKPYIMANELQLESDKNTLAFTFSNLQFSLPKKNMYQYRLLNHDNNWVFSGNNNYVRYTLLPPGDYQFQVKSSNYDGLWNEQPETYIFSIKAPWYFNTNSKILYLLLFLMLLFGIYKYLKWRWKMQLNLQLKKEETTRLQKLNSFRSKLYTNIAHEFKTPLTLISGPIDQQLTKEGLTDNDYSNFSMIKRNTYRMTSLVDQLLQLSKLEEGKLKKNVTEGDLALFLHMISRSFEYQSSLKNIKYEINIKPTGIVWYDEDILEKITTNLLSNAFKYSLEKGHCKFLVEQDHDTVFIKVQNTIQKDTKLHPEKLFDRFYQSNEYTEGIGVGLSLVKELVTFYNGTISAEMVKKDTISFEVILPLLEENYLNANTTSNHESTKTIPANLNALYGKKFTTKNKLPILLIVEDYTEIRSFIKRSFQEKFRVLEAENGKIGVVMALKHVPDIIVSDIRMPVLSGIELCNTLRNKETTSHIPIILLTANNSEEMELKGLASGADDFVSKPFKIKLLEKRMQNLISKRQALRIHYSKELVLKPKNIVLNSADELFFNKIQQILDDHLSNPLFNASMFSTKAHMSRMQLHRKLLAFTGLSTSAFIRSQRLKQAKQLLENSDVTINEIAYAVGFNTPTYFMKSFKETFRKTPSEYVSSLKK